jgi:hypothetical protein
MGYAGARALATAAIALTILLAAPRVAGQDSTARDSTPRDTTRWATVFRRTLLEGLPFDEPRQAAVLLPGVMLRGDDRGIGSATTFTVHGGVTGGAGVLLNGTQIRSELFGIPLLEIPANALAELALSTGIPDVQMVGGRAGVISYTTGAAGRIAALRVETDGPFGSGSAVGFNRLAGTVGGPLQFIPHLQFFAAGSALGQGSQYRGLGAADVQTYGMSGIDTIVGADTLRRFVQVNGLERPVDWVSSLRFLGTLAYDDSARTRIVVTAAASGRQQRFFPGTDLVDPAIYEGSHSWSRLVAINASRALGRLGSGPITVDAALSIGTDRLMDGSLQPGSEAETRDPGLGIEMRSLGFVGGEVIPFPITEQIIRNIRNNSGVRVPYPTVFGGVSQSGLRLNPFALSRSWPNAGLDGILTFASERRVTVGGGVEWRPGSTQRLRLGFDATRTNASYYSADLLRTQEMDAFIVHPRRTGAYVGDAIRWRSFTFDLGLRYDHVQPGGLIPNTPGRIFTNPGWSLVAATNDTAYANSISRVFTPTRGQTALTPRLRAAYRAGPRTTLRAEYASVVEPPTLLQLFGGSNADLSFTTSNDLFGRDVSLLRTSLLSAGIRQDFGSVMSFDVALYSQGSGRYGGRAQQFADPHSPPDSVQLVALVSRQLPRDVGIDVRLDYHPNERVHGTLAYGFLHTDQPIDSVATHTLSAMAMVTLPHTWGGHTVLGAVGRDLQVTLVARTASGIPYTLLVNVGRGSIAPDRTCCGAEPFNSSRLPWNAAVDLRLTKAVTLGGRSWTAYIDVRNLLGLDQFLGVYAETGSPVNTRFRANVLAPEISQLANEAATNGVLLNGNDVDLRPSCDSWGRPINCVALRRAERRFGNGDGIYTFDEQVRALDAYFDAYLGTWRLRSPGRTVRIGASLTW